jgi:hypothetical protein
VNQEPKIDHRMMWRKYRWENGLVGEKEIVYLCSDPNSDKWVVVFHQIMLAEAPRF